MRTQVDFPADASLADDQRWLLVQRIVSSPGFVNSQRLSAFLLYVSRQSLLGNGDALNERLIGEEVFERSPDYDPRDDNIVRSHASRLRARLEEYFEREGATETLRLRIPRGGYVPVFEPAESEVEKPEPSEPDAMPAVQNEETLARRVRLPLHLTVWLAAGVVLLGGIATVITLRHARSVADQSPSHKLWSQMFRDGQQTLIVPADSSLVIALLLSGKQVGLAAYASGQYREAPDCSKPCDREMIRTIQGLRYTSMSDLEFAVKITRLPEAIADRTEIRYARDIQLNDLKQANLILAGSQEADPWMAAISGAMTFVIQDDPAKGPLRVENKRPQPGEKAEYAYEDHDPQHGGLATISFLSNLGGTGNLLVVQGFSLAGTQAAAEFVTSRKDLDALLRPYGGDRSALPHFEILLSTLEINGMATHAVPLALHILP